VENDRGRGLAVWIATSGGAGFFPIWPGTIGAAVGLVVVAALQRLPLTEAELSAIVGFTASAVFGLGVWAAGHAERLFGCPDPSPVVVDEVVGQMVTFLACPGASWKVLLVGFALFRFFDIVKPFPAGRAEHLPGGWGIMTDDVVAGIYSLAGLCAVRLVLK
jgi:phosphatidylglycerophosphatase A